MGNNIFIPMQRKEDTEAARKRREEYALSRDQLASEYNDAIAKSYNANKSDRVKCTKCGREFISTVDTGEEPVCPDCK
ncbi:MAG TPA: hypothetical protein VJ963_04260 [Bacteroidales bacterium]|nr:hypothetical protein [Bacteroidales bacterium]